MSTCRSTTTRRLDRILAGHSAVVYLFFYLPLVVLIVFSFNDSRFVNRWEGFTLDWYRAIPKDQALMNAVKNSLIIALISTVVATVLGTMAALALERYKKWLGKRTFDALLYLPVIIPDVTMAVMLLIFFTQVNQALGLDHHHPQPHRLQHLLRGDRGEGPGVQSRSEPRGGGLRPLRLAAGSRSGKVTLPLIMPGVLGGALLALTLSLDDVVITSFVQGPGATPLAVEVFARIKRGVTPIINAVSTLMLVASILLILGSLIVQRRQGSSTRGG